MADYDTPGGSLRQQLGRIEERATAAADGAHETAKNVAQLGREVSALSQRMESIDVRQQLHFENDDDRFAQRDTLITANTARITAIEKSDATTIGARTANRWWVTALATIGGAVAGGLAGNFRIFGGH